MQNIELLKVNDSVTEEMVAEHQTTRVDEEQADLMVEQLTKPIKFRCVNTPNIQCRNNDDDDCEFCG